jgi:hypothetical protein
LIGFVTAQAAKTLLTVLTAKTALAQAEALAAEARAAETSPAIEISPTEEASSYPEEDCLARFANYSMGELNLLEQSMLHSIDADILAGDSTDRHERMLRAINEAMVLVAARTTVRISADAHSRNWPHLVSPSMRAAHVEVPEPNTTGGMQFVRKDMSQFYSDSDDSSLFSDSDDEGDSDDEFWRYPSVYLHD